MGPWRRGGRRRAAPHFLMARAAKAAGELHISSRASATWAQSLCRCALRFRGVASPVARLARLSRAGLATRRRAPASRGRFFWITELSCDSYMGCVLCARSICTCMAMHLPARTPTFRMCCGGHIYIRPARTAATHLKRQRRRLRVAGTLSQSVSRTTPSTISLPMMLRT